MLATSAAYGQEPPIIAPSVPPGSPPEQQADKTELQELKARLDAQQAEIEALTSGTETAEKQPRLRFYGFADAGINKVFGANSFLDAILPSRANTFVMGNINLYLHAQPTESWTVMIETRPTNAPNGDGLAANPGQGYEQVNTNVLDPTAPYARVRWGGIAMERAYVQYRHSDLLEVRAGLFPTPFVIWNLDHGTPTLISLTTIAAGGLHSGCAAKLGARCSPGAWVATRTATATSGGSPNRGVRHWTRPAPATRHLHHLEALITARPWWKLVPDIHHEVLTDGNGIFGDNGYALAARAFAGSFALAYVPTARAITHPSRP